MAIIVGQYPDDETDITEQPTEPIPVQSPSIDELIRQSALYQTRIDDFDACVLCMRSYEQRYGRPVDGVDYNSNHLGLCQHHLWLWMSAHTAELELLRAQLDESYARYRGTA